MARGLGGARLIDAADWAGRTNAAASRREVWSPEAGTEAAAFGGCQGRPNQGEMAGGAEGGEGAGDRVRGDRLCCVCCSVFRPSFAISVLSCQ